jgi:hypothetical protein
MNQDRDHAADELDTLLTALLAGQDAPAPEHLPAEEAALAAELLHLAADTQLNPIFAADLESRLLARAELLSAASARAASAPAQHRASVPARPPTWRRRATWAAAATIILAMLLAVPPVRASMLRFLQIGAVRIRLAEPPIVASVAPATTERVPPPTPLAAVLDLAGETTLAAAQSEVSFPIRVPGYPANLGPPDRVFVQDLGGTAVVLVWEHPDRPGQVQLSLHQLGSGIDLEKIHPVTVQETAVHGQPALWTKGP